MKKEVAALAKTVAKKTQPDAVVWFAYPKSTSKNYTSEISRDAGNEALGDAGFAWRFSKAGKTKK